MSVLLLGERQIGNLMVADVVSTFSNVSTSLTLGSGQGSRFPSAPFALIMWDNYFGNPADARWGGSAQAEVILVTAKSGDVLTVVRGIEGTTAFTPAHNQVKVALAATWGFLENVQKRLNVRSYGGKIDGSTNDTAAILEAINDLPSVGGEIFIPRGSGPCIVTQNTNWDASNGICITKSHVALIGEAGSIIKGAAGAGTSSYLINVRGTVATPITDILIKGIELHGNVQQASLPFSTPTQSPLINLLNVKRMAIEGMYLHDSPGDGIRFDWEDLSSLAEDITIRDVVINTVYRNGMSILACDRVNVTNVKVLNYSCMGLDVEPDNPGDDCRNITFADCYAKPAATWLNKKNSNRAYGFAAFFTTGAAGAGQRNISWKNCVSEGLFDATDYTSDSSDPPSQYPRAGFWFQQFKNMSFSDCKAYSCRQGFYGASDVSGGTVQLSNCSAYGSIGSSSGVGFGVQPDAIVTGCFAEECDGPGLLIQARCKVTGGVYRNNNRATSPTFLGGINVQSDDNEITGVKCYDTHSPKKQTHGIYIADGATGNQAFNNDLRNNLTNGIRLPAAANYVRQNPGFATENRGTDTIASGSTSKSVTHGLAITPRASEIMITFTGDATTDPTRFWWITGIDSNSFTINVHTAPGGSGLGFEWAIIPRPN